MLNLNIKIHTGYSAYRADSQDEDGNYKSILDPANTEIIRDLKSVIANLENGCTAGVINDINGNKTGEWSLEM